MYSLLAAVIGALTAVMIALNGALAHFIGNAAASTVIHLTGLLLVGLLVVLNRSPRTHPTAIPPLLLSGGALGFLSVICANRGVLDVGVSLTLALGLLGQTVAALIIDHQGWFGASIVPFDARKLGSLALLLSGIGLMAAR